MGSTHHLPPPPVFHLFVPKLVHLARRGMCGVMAPRLCTITVKYAQTLDGRIATASGHSRWITGLEARTVAHQLRADHDAVMVGINTVLADNPELTVRLIPGRDPARVVLDSQLRIPLSAHLLKSGSPRTIVAARTDADPHRRAALVSAGVTVLSLPASERGVSLPALFAMLSGLGIRSVLAEGGAAVITALLRERLADRLVVFVAPRISGTGIEAVGPLGTTAMDDAISLEDVTIDRAGQDFVVSGRPRWPEHYTSEPDRPSAYRRP